MGKPAVIFTTDKNGSQSRAWCVMSIVIIASCALVSLWTVYRYHNMLLRLQLVEEQAQLCYHAQQDRTLAKTSEDVHVASPQWLHALIGRDVSAQRGDVDDSSVDDEDLSEDNDWVEPVLSRARRDADPTPKRKRLEIRRHRNKKDNKRSNKKVLKACEKRAKAVSLKVVQDHQVSMAHFAAGLDPQLDSIKTSVANVTLPFGKLSRGVLHPTANVSYRFWRKTDDSDRDTFRFNTTLGQVTIQRPGTYLVYAQVLYLEGGPRVAFSVNVDNKPVTKCLMSSSDLSLRDEGAPRHEDYQMCSTTVAVVLRAGSKLDVFPLYVGQSLVIDKATTLWGLVRLGG